VTDDELKAIEATCDVTTPQSITGGATVLETRALIAEVRRLRGLLDARSKTLVAMTAMCHRTEAQLATARAEALHWKRIAMHEAGFAFDVVDAVLGAPVPLTEAEQVRCKQILDEWTAKRALATAPAARPDHDNGCVCAACCKAAQEAAKESGF
jgi:hypothetical protein